MPVVGLLSEPLPRLIAQIALIVLVSRLLGFGARRLGQPMVIAEITAGVLLGPSLFGLLLPDAYHLVFAPESLKVLGLVSQLGLVLFMFLIGLELDPAMLRGRTQSSVAISHASIVVPSGWDDPRLFLDRASGATGRRSSRSRCSWRRHEHQPHSPCSRAS